MTIGRACTLLVAAGAGGRHASVMKRLRGRRGRSLISGGILAAALWLPAPAPGAVLTGKVLSNDQPLAGAFVAALGPGGRTAGVADGSGQYALSLPGGTY